MDFDVLIAVAGLLVGFVVGLTGMGGGALMTPVLVLFFDVAPLAAVSSDLVASAVMKPVGSAVHLRRGTVHRGLVRWLVVGSVPAAFGGVLVLQALGDGADVQHRIKVVLGATLLLAAASMALKAILGLRAPVGGGEEAAIQVRRLPTVVVGVIGGIVVGMTSVGSGSLIIVMLLVLYPTLRANQLVGTDLVQAVPLVLAASVGHLLFGDFQLDVTTSLLVGALPGVYVGARISSVASSGFIRPTLAFVITASGLKLVGVPTAALGLVLLGILIVSPLVWRMLRRRLAPEGPTYPDEPATERVPAGGPPPAG